MASAGLGEQGRDDERDLPGPDRGDLDGGVERREGRQGVVAEPAKMAWMESVVRGGSALGE